MGLLGAGIGVMLSLSKHDATLTRFTCNPLISVHQFRVKPASNVGFRADSFSDAEARENLVEQIFDIDASRQTPDLISRDAHVFGGQFGALIERWDRAQ
jgi:hypothetical protein